MRWGSHCAGDQARPLVHQHLAGPPRRGQHLPPPWQWPDRVPARWQAQAKLPADEQAGLHLSDTLWRMQRLLCPSYQQSFSWEQLCTGETPEFKATPSRLKYLFSPDSHLCTCAVLSAFQIIPPFASKFTFWQPGHSYFVFSQNGTTGLNDF